MATAAMDTNTQTAVMTPAMQNKLLESPGVKALLGDLKSVRTKENEKEVDALVTRVQSGEFYDGNLGNLSPHQAPKLKLHHALQQANLIQLAQRTFDGNYDDDD